MSSLFYQRLFPYLGSSARFSSFYLSVKFSLYLDYFFSILSTDSAFSPVTEMAFFPSVYGSQVSYTPRGSSPL